jgi:phosphoserine phosphatase RsbU/P
VGEVSGDAFHILVVDPDRATRERLGTELQRRTRDNGWTFHAVASAEDALLRLHEEPRIELVITEFDLPGMDGTELLARLREQPAAPKAIVLTARNGLESVRAAMNRGALDFLVKSANMADIEEAIERGREQVEERRRIVADRDLLLRIQGELMVASEIQRSLLPETPSPDLPADRVALRARMIPAKDIGGDFFDFFPIDERTIAVAVGDVAGKGVPAALLMAVTQTLVRASATPGTTTGEILAEVNRQLCRRRDSYLFVTLFVGVYSLDSGMLQYTSAGHPTPLLLSPGMPLSDLPPVGGMPAGIVPEAAYEYATQTLKPGDGLFVYTDGLTEARGRDGVEFGEGRLRSILESAGGADPDTLMSRIYGVVEGFTAGAHAHDDITTLVLRRSAAG